MISRNASRVLALLATSLSPGIVACSSDEEKPNPTPTAGTGGNLATSGSGGARAGSGGSGGVPSGGTSAGGTAGVASGGKAGAGAGGFASGGAGAPSGGMAGASAGSAGAAAAGTSGAGGRGGAAGAGGTASGGGGVAGGAAGKGSGGAGGAGAFVLTNPDFANMEGCSKAMATACAIFPRELASYMSGPNMSPELAWSGTPAGTQSYALLLQDLSNGFAHWVLWNIPGTLSMLPENIDKSSAMPAMPAGSQQTNAGQGDGYFGPGSACNVYEFVLYALAMPTFTPTSTTDASAVRTQLDALSATQVLGKASLRGRQNYEMKCQ